MRARLLVLAAAVLFSTGGAAIKSTSLTAWQVASFRSGIAALAVLVMLRGARRLPDRATWLVGVVYAATLVFFVFANKNTTAANAIYLQGTAPLYILLAAPFVLRERVSRADIVFMAALGLGLGAFFLGQEPARETAPNPALGNMAALASGLTWAATVMGLRWLGRRSDDPTATATLAGGRKCAGVRADARPGAAGRRNSRRATWRSWHSWASSRSGWPTSAWSLGSGACRRWKPRCCCYSNRC